MLGSPLRQCFCMLLKGAGCMVGSALCLCKPWLWVFGGGCILGPAALWLRAALCSPGCCTVVLGLCKPLRPALTPSLLGLQGRQ